jgi:tRNA G10  N-methylase Trm11
MFSELPFDKTLVDLSNFEMVYKVIKNDADGEIYFGEQVASARIYDSNGKDETFHSKYDLKLRPYLGPTSTDHELALLMVNQG